MKFLFKELFTFFLGGRKNAEKRKLTFFLFPSLPPPPTTASPSPTASREGPRSTLWPAERCRSPRQPGPFSSESCSSPSRSSRPTWRGLRASRPGGRWRRCCTRARPWWRRCGFYWRRRETAELEERRLRQRAEEAPLLLLPLPRGKSSTRARLSCLPLEATL